MLKALIIASCLAIAVSRLSGSDATHSDQAVGADSVAEQQRSSGREVTETNAAGDAASDAGGSAKASSTAASETSSASDAAGDAAGSVKTSSASASELTASVSAGADCHPQCSWKCDSPVCDQICDPVCEVPRCTTTCSALPCSKCEVKCAPPQCEVSFVAAALW
jgi:hypothetical protein